MDYCLVMELKLGKAVLPRSESKGVAAEAGERMIYGA